MNDLSNKNPVNIGLLGLGVVGGGVAAALLEQPEAISAQTGRPVNLKKVLVRDASRQRDVQLPDGIITTNPEDILADPDISLVVEVIGGENPASQYLQDALKSGKHVVTANKEVMAKRGPEFLSLARRHNVNLLYEASVGGGIPIIGCLVKELACQPVPLRPQHHQRHHQLHPYPDGQRPHRLSPWPCAEAQELGLRRGRPHQRHRRLRRRLQAVHSGRPGLPPPRVRRRASTGRASPA